MTKRRYDGLLIDFYGTISDGDRDAVNAACRSIVQACDLTLTPEELAVVWGERFFEVVEQSNHDRFRTLYECELGSLRDTLADLGRADVDPIPFVAQLEEYWADPAVHPDAVEFLENVDLPVCCVSNADTTPLSAAIRKHRLSFDAVVTSQAARCYKPDPAIFEQAVRALGVDPRRTMHIGDSLHSDVGGATKLGITATWICRENRIHDIGTSDPDHVVGSLADIFALLR